ncbi:small heat shock protein [Carex littledalei]|uniref:Small heat shock protein n=1 Tax=Carex littledalei TaxID=544730 RepID=A0A833QQZ2_9POAL|nr:small heat shock protein [Carex littledalei]
MAARALSNRTSTANTLLQSLGRCSFNRTVGAALGVVANQPLTTNSPDAATSRPATAPAPARGGCRDDFLPAFFSDPRDPFNPGRTLSQVLNFMDQLTDVPLGGRGMLRTGWDAREDDKSLYLKVEMPGLSKDDIKVFVEGTTLVIKGEKQEENRTVNAEDDITAAEGNQGQGQGRARRRYSSRIEIPEKGYKLDQIKAEMKHGVLRVVIPKVQEEERGGVIEVQIDG